jgi:hypothetical protein
MIIKSKYDGYGKIELKETGRDYDFIAYVENNTDKTLKLYIDDLEGWCSEPIQVAPNDWVGFLADDVGRGQVKSIKNGDFKAVLEEPPMEIYIVFEYAEHTNKIVGCYKNEEDANKNHKEAPMWRFIEKQQLI